MIIDAFKPIDYGGIEVVDIIRNYRSYVDRVLRRYQLEEFVIVGDPTTEMLSYSLYGDPNLFWLIIYINDIIDPWHGWVKDPEAVLQSAEQKYKNWGGTSQVVYHMTRDFEKFYDLVEDPDNKNHWYHKGDKIKKHVQYIGQLYPVSVYEDEAMKNDGKRRIKIIKPSDMQRFATDLRSEIDKIKRSGL